MLSTAKKYAKRVIRKNWVGHCPICEGKTRFMVRSPVYRDNLLCERCISIPRERALMRVLKSLYPDWRNLSIHESSPVSRGTSKKLASECLSYIASQYMPELESGTTNMNGHVSQDLEQQSFADEQFDIVVTQDVFEHLFHPDKAIAEIARTLKPGGAHIMSVPLVNKAAPSKRQARMEGGQVIHLGEPDYHGNPVGDGASLVTMHWGYDIADYLTAASGCPTTVHTIDDLSQGIRADLIEIVVTRKGAVPVL